MSFHLKVLVELPDGSHAYLPICAYSDGADPSKQIIKIREFDSKKDAMDWAEFCLPGKLRFG